MIKFPLEIENLSFRYPTMEEAILKSIDLQVNWGEVLGIVGLSGNGKSTFCYCACGIIPHIYKGELEGSIRLLDKNTKDMTLAAIATRVGVVFQEPDTQLFSPTVEDELAFGPENLCLDRDKIGIRISEAIADVGMEKHLLNNPFHLSGGEKQLIALASALSLKPQILILDEIMAHIDEKGKKIIKEKILTLRDKGKTIIMVEHDLANLDIADRIMVLRHGKLYKYDGVLR